MEDASKALIMAGGVLLGIMIISIGVYLFFTYAEYSSGTYSEIEKTQIDQFNTQFLKYYGNQKTEYTDSSGVTKEKTTPILCTAHDIISLTNFAKQSNIQWDVQNLTKYDKNTYYVQVDIVGTNKASNLEKWNDNQQLDFIQKNSIHDVQVTDEAGNSKQEKQTKYYMCAQYPEISDITKRVCYIQFKEYNP